MQVGHARLENHGNEFFAVRACPFALDSNFVHQCSIADCGRAVPRTRLVLCRRDLGPHRAFVAPAFRGVCVPAKSTGRAAATKAEAKLDHAEDDFAAGMACGV
jgi:hypothetical protein